jgi:putative transposase
MPNYRRLFQPGGTFFFTLVTAGRRPLFAQESARRCLHQTIGETQARWPFDLTAVVLLPDHLHCIWKLPEDDADYSTRWACIKKAFSRLWLASGGAETAVSRARQAHRETGVWQRRFWEHTIRDEDDFLHHVNYIHYNPIKHGLARCPHAWPWSSFHRWVEQGYYRPTWLCDCDAPVTPPAALVTMPNTGE